METMETILIILNVILIFSIGLFTKFYLPSYFKSKGENLAKIEDLMKIDGKIEEIKTENAKNLEEFKTEINHKATIELETIKTRLLTEYEVAKTYLVKYSQEQFIIYNNLWTNLCELELHLDKLWDQASLPHLKKFALQLKLTRDSLKKGALLIEDGHYKELNFILDSFEEFQFGKKTLIDIRKKSETDTFIDMDDIRRTINSNMSIRDDLKNNLLQMMDCLKRQIAYKNQINNA